MNNLKDRIKQNQTLYSMASQIRLFFLKIPSREAKIKFNYRKNLGKRLDLTAPKTYNEKLQWLKLNWYDEDAKKCADKYEVRQYVKDKIGEEYLNELIDVAIDVEDIIFENLPDQFVIKGTHGSGFNIICRDKSKLDWKISKQKIKNWLRTDYSLFDSEWVYEGLKPRIIIEKYLEDNKVKELRDYKFFCFDGEPKFMFVGSDRGNDTRFDYFDLNWNKIPVHQLYKNSDKDIEKPAKFDEMIELSKKLSLDFPHVRVDFFECNDRIYFSELTFFHFSGTQRFYPSKYDDIFGEYINLELISQGSYVRKKNE